MNSKIIETIHLAQSLKICQEREFFLQKFIDFIQLKTDQNLLILLNFICTHNSRRSHLSQVWAQVAANFHQIPNVYCYSGGTEETALFPQVAITLENQGFEILQLSVEKNPVYAIKYDADSPAIIGFSKKYNSAFNPQKHFAAILTCTQADEGCPFITGAEARISLPFLDPKTSDNTFEQKQVYAQRSLEIASELLFVFSKIDKK